MKHTFRQCSHRRLGRQREGGEIGPLAAKTVVLQWLTSSPITRRQSSGSCDAASHLLQDLDLQVAAVRSERRLQWQVQWKMKEGGGNGNPLQYSCLENSMDRGAWGATVHGITRSQTQLSNFTSPSLSKNFEQLNPCFKTKLLWLFFSESRLIHYFMPCHAPDLQRWESHTCLGSHTGMKDGMIPLHKRILKRHHKEWGRN